MTQPKRLTDEELDSLFLRMENGESVSSEDLKGHIQAIEAELMVTDEKFRDWQNIANDRSKEICRLMAREAEHKREVDGLRDSIKGALAALNRKSTTDQEKSNIIEEIIDALKEAKK